MLAQAQSLMFEKAIKDKLSPSVLARLAQQVSSFYHRAHSLCVTTRVSVPKEWTDRLLFQARRPRPGLQRPHAPSPAPTPAVQGV